jgi:hypothetical protein
LRWRGNTTTSTSLSTFRHEAIARNTCCDKDSLDRDSNSVTREDKVLAALQSIEAINFSHSTSSSTDLFSLTISRRNSTISRLTRANLSSKVSSARSSSREVLYDRARRFAISVSEKSRQSTSGQNTYPQYLHRLVRPRNEILRTRLRSSLFRCPCHRRRTGVSTVRDCSKRDGTVTVDTSSGMSTDSYTSCWSRSYLLGRLSGCGQYLANQRIYSCWKSWWSQFQLRLTHCAE